MLKNRILLLLISILVVVLLFQLPKSVVENDAPVAVDSLQRVNPEQANTGNSMHSGIPVAFKKIIADYRTLWANAAEKEKKAIFADSLANRYLEAGVFDSAGWFAEDAASFFNTVNAWEKAGDAYFQAFTFAIDAQKQKTLAEKAQNFYQKVLEKQPDNLVVKNNLAMTYLSSANPMQGVLMLREVLAQDPKNETALFNLGMLSIQSGQYENAIERLQQLLVISPEHIQGNLLLGLAYMNTNQKEKARSQFEKVKKMDPDPAVQATVDSYLKDLK
ncbi:MAG: tetratricopeptide repeat protein [Cyclobacteriaceae bacterium]|jgi:tetratricopeptide (TPR) repeat protein|nr:tetratricopeptide repeat protein [Flammeovirgaceae bacterium]MCZ8020859.1 tetratricopeptide repeat protein [Cytophagales bacterium]MCZ8328473.1 tetratricopeptide repeat protein [Cyclobacteriaceae bacterium]